MLLSKFSSLRVKKQLPKKVPVGGPDVKEHDVQSQSATVTAQAVLCGITFLSARPRAKPSTCMVTFPF